MMFTIDSEIENYNQYKIFLKKIYKYESQNYFGLLSSILIIPIILTLKILLLTYLTIKYSLYGLLGLFYVIKETIDFVKEEFVYLSDKMLYVLRLILDIVILCYYYKNPVLISLSSINLVYCILYFFKYSNLVMISLINFNVNSNRYIKYRFSKFIHFALNIGLIVLMNSYNCHIGIIISCIICTSVDIMLHMILPYYMKYKCERIDLLIFYDVIERVNELQTNELLDEINKIIKLEKHNHVCEENCSSCPCGICYEKIVEGSKLKCGHEFCYNCIHKSMVYSYTLHKKINCPYCRIDLV